MCIFLLCQDSKELNEEKKKTSYHLGSTLLNGQQKFSMHIRKLALKKKDGANFNKLYITPMDTFFLFHNHLNPP